MWGCGRRAKRNVWRVGTQKWEEGQEGSLYTHRRRRGSPRGVYRTSKEREAGCASTTTSHTEWDTGIMGELAIHELRRVKIQNIENPMIVNRAEFQLRFPPRVMK